MRELTPWFERKEKFNEFIDLFAYEFQLTHDESYQIILDVWDLISHSGQVGVYEEYLNDKFDYTERRIYITHLNSANSLKTLYLVGEYDPTPDTLYLQVEKKSNWELYLQSEISGLTFFSFTINVPVSIWSEMTEQEKNKFYATADIYKMAGKTYNVETF